MSLDKHDLPPIAAPRMALLPPYLFGRINAMRDALNAQGRDVVDLGMGNPTDPAPETAITALKKALEKPAIHRYPAARGILPLRQSLARFYKRRYGVDLDPETETIVTIGSKEGISHLLLATVGPQDAVMVPLPAFPPHLYGPMLAGGVSIGVPLSLGDEGFLERVELLCRTMTPKPKLLILCSPHNPTGHTVDAWFYEKAVALAKEYGFHIISDTAYAQTVYDDYVSPSILQVDGGRDVAIEFFTMSKPYNMAGWRIGYGVGNRDLVNLLGSIKGYYDYGLFLAIQEAAAETLDNCDAMAAEQAAIYQERRDILCDGLEEMGFRFERPRGGMFVWTHLPQAIAAMPTMEFAERLMNEAAVAVAPGSGFGKEGEGALRMAIVEPKERIAEAVRRMKDWLSRTTS